MGHDAALVTRPAYDLYCIIDTRHGVVVKEADRSTVLMLPSFKSAAMYATYLNNGQISSERYQAAIMPIPAGKEFH